MIRQLVNKAQKTNNSTLLPRIDMLQRNTINPRGLTSTVDMREPLEQQIGALSLSVKGSHFNHDFSKIAPYLVRPKLKIGQTNDRYEQEADQLAERVMRMPEGLRLTCACGGGCPNCQTDQLGPGREQLHTKRSEPSDSRQIDAPGIVHQALQLPGQSLDPTTRDFMELRFGNDFSRVRVHTNYEAAESAQAIGALAYTLNHDIVFAAGQYRPDTESGKRILAHELAHVIQMSSRGLTPIIRRQEFWPGGMPNPETESEERARERPSTFCQPFSTRAAAERDFHDRWPSIRSQISLYVDERTAGIYDLYVSGGATSEQDLSSTFAQDFADSVTTRRVVDRLMAALRQSLTERPLLLPQEITKLNDLPVSERIANEISAIGNRLSSYRMNFTWRTEPPAIIAGDIGDSDERSAQVEVDLTRLNTGEIHIQPRIMFTVRDIVDFCPGNPGDAQEQEITVSLSRWEASGLAGDFPFRVNFTVRPLPFTAPVASAGTRLEGGVSEIVARYLYIAREVGRRPPARTAEGLERLPDEWIYLAEEIRELVRVLQAAIQDEHRTDIPTAREILREEILNDGRLDLRDADFILSLAGSNSVQGSEATTISRED